MIDLRRLPSVDRLLKHADTQLLIERFGRVLVLGIIQDILEDIRQKPNEYDVAPDAEFILSRCKNLIEHQLKPTLTGVINASGVVLHTNLGRAPLCRDALDAIRQTAGGFSTLEYDLGSGKRGSRNVHAGNLLRLFSGAEDALVVNNNAAAVLLCLSALARNRGVVISRSQLVEIGGGFRIPDVMKQSGARLVEIGTTNRVNLADYESALQDGAALLMRAHTSNFKLVGFTAQPELEDMVRIAHQYEVPVLDDLGSGAFIDTARYGLAHEPMVQESLKAGVDLVCFSADKLLGGPQAGIILGKAQLIARLKRHPLARAIRADKLCLAALSATLLHYLMGDAEKEIPVWQMISADPVELKKRAENWQQKTGGEVIEERSTIGGGSLPDETLPTFVLSFVIPRPDQAAAKLRQATPALIARVQGGRLLLDPRTVLPEEDAQVIEILNTHITGAGS
ncbi:MAG TPA: L-seryl-tRNA(Sec) selenium transferase [Anaerolineaceae bacterium]|nr:L-seryl-tRNA(Sec) selenium transferase [Anaerolineaceae bacterium]